METPMRPTAGRGMRDASNLFDPTRNDQTMLEVRGLMPTSKLLGTGPADRMDVQLNDPTMLEIRKRGTPSANRMPMWTPSKGAGDPGMEPMPSMPMRPTEPRRPVVPMGGMPGGAGSMEPMPSMPSMPMARGSRLGFSPMNRGVPPGFSMEGPLSGRGARPVGRSMKEAPERRLETAARYGDMRAARALVDFKQAGEERAFRRQQDQLNFGQNLALNEMQQQRQDQRFEQERVDRFGMFGLEQGARKEQEAERWNQTLKVFGMEQGADAMKAERERQQREADRKAKLDFGLKRVDTPESSTPYYQNYEGGIQAGAAPRGLVKPPEGMEAQGATVDGVRYGRPAAKEEKMPKFQTDGDGKLYYVVPNGNGGYVRKFVDEDGDGKPDTVAQGGAGAAAAPQGGWKSLIPQGY